MKKDCYIRVEGISHFNAVNDAIIGEMVKDFPPNAAKKALDIAMNDADFECDEEREDAKEELERFFTRLADPHSTDPATELCTRGLFDFSAHAAKISYVESELIGHRAVRTTFSVLPNGMVTLIRRGKPGLCMVFEKGKRHLCDYGEHLSFPVCLYTRDLSCEMTAVGGRLHIDYMIEVGGSKSEHNEFNIEVRI